MSDDVRMNISVALQQVFEATKQKGGVPDEEFVDACIRDIKWVMKLPPSPKYFPTSSPYPTKLFPNLKLC